ncbi:MAG: hypothetical protein HYY52_01645 [Candidatus Melainabacteria bacterium]|nr:hypothetical protein [Candidatus Melainabacteria bacterium]
MTTTITDATCKPSGRRWDTLIRSATAGKMNWQALINNQKRLTKEMGEERFNQLLETALAGRGQGNFI